MRTYTNTMLTVTHDQLQKPGSVLLEDQLGQGWGGGSAWFTDPVRVLTCHDPEQLQSTLTTIDNALEDGLHAAGFISYEAGSALVPHQEHRDCGDFPLVWMGLYDKVQITKNPVITPHPPAAEHLEPILDVTAQKFSDDVEKILEYIRGGETYQVNYTCRTRFSTTLAPWELYLLLKRAQPVPYAALLNCGDFTVISQSPELFLEKSGSTLEGKPMKGTASRGKNKDEDQEQVRWLGNSEKNRAENLMIVDLMRNDIGRLAKTGSVEVFDPFQITAFRTLHQMTTGVRGQVPHRTAVSHILEHTFPPGSITGAPKVRTMQIIRELERSPRKVYTGAIGRFHPGGDLAMNVAIRTIIMDPEGICEMGVGSGIVADSQPAEEHEETVLKASFVNHLTGGETDLLETMLLDNNGALPYLSEHMDRISRSATALGYPFDGDSIRTSLMAWLGADMIGPAVVRMRLDHRGGTWFELLPFPGTDGGRGLKILLSSTAIDETDPLLLHKTTARATYDQQHAAVRDKGFDEVIFTNNAGELTEGAITNLFIHTADGWITPQLFCGLLPGTWRARFLAETRAIEKGITPEIFSRAMEVVVGNGVRGKMIVSEILDEKGEILYWEKQVSSLRA
jgi:para-aminobenzoate synthetase/4-amino-4-deoxychorismate lyase